MKTGQIGGQVIVVSLGNLFTLLVGLPFQIYVARVLGADQLGRFGLAEAVTTTIGGFVTMGVALTALRFIPEYRSRGEFGHIRTLAALATSVLVVTGILVAGGVALFSGSLLGHWGVQPRDRALVAIMSLTIPATLLIFLYQQILRSLHEIVLLIFSSSVVMLTIKVAATILFLNLGWGAAGYAWAVVLANILTLAILVFAAVRLILRLGPPSSREAAPVRTWVHYAGVMYVNSLAGAAVANLDRFIVGALAGPPAVAVLMVAKQLYQLPSVFNTMMLTVVTPLFSAAAGEADPNARRQALYHTMTDWVIRLALPLILFLAVFGGPVLHLYGPHFGTQGLPLLLLCLGWLVINLGYGPVGNLMNMSGLERPLMVWSFTSTGLIVVAYFLLIPWLGLAGVGVALVLGAVFLNVFTLRILQRKLSFRWWDDRYRAWIAHAAVPLVLLLILRWVTGWEETASIPWLIVALGTAYGGALLANILTGFHQDDRDVFHTVLARLRRRPAA